MATSSPVPVFRGSVMDVHEFMVSHNMEQGAEYQIRFCACKEDSLVSCVIIRMSGSFEFLTALLQLKPDDQHTLVKSLVGMLTESEGGQTRLRYKGRLYHMSLVKHQSDGTLIVRIDIL